MGRALSRACGLTLSSPPLPQIVFVLAGFLTYSEPGVFFVLLLLYIISLIFFCFMLSTLFSKSNIAAAAGAMLTFLAYIPYLFIQNTFEDLSQGEKRAACLLAPTCMGIGTTILSIFETRGQGLDSSNLGESPTELDAFSMSDVYGMLILDIILYGILTW